MTISTEQTPPEEQRKYPRRSFLKPVTIYAGDRTSSGMIQDISKGGVYIEAKESVSIGQKISISYLAANDTDEIEVQGEVVWTDQSGFAMKYIQNPRMTISTEQTPLEEQRKHPRRSFLKPVTIYAGDRIGSGMIQDISKGGVYIEAKESVSIGQKISISYLAANGKDEIEVQGEVVWTDQSGFAMKCI